MKSIPKYSIRQLLLGMIAVAVVLACLGSAVRGSFIGTCVASGILLMSVSWVVMGFVYWSSLGWRILLNGFRRSNAFIFLLGGLAGTLGSSESIGQLIPAGEKGYLITIDDSYPVSKFGYVPLRITLEKFPAVAVTSPESYTVVLKSQYYQSGSTIAPLEIEVGESSATAQVFVPQHVVNSRYHRIHILKGKSDSIYSSPDLYSTYVHANSSSSNLSKAWITSQAAKDTGVTVGIWGRSASGATIPKSHPAGIERPFSSLSGGGVTMSVGGGTWTVNEPTPIHPANVPQTWVGLSGVEIIFVTLDELKLHYKNKPWLCHVLENWVAVGGTLVVFDLNAQQLQTDENLTSSNKDGWQNVNSIMPILLGQKRNDEISKTTDVWFQPTDDQLGFQIQTDVVQPNPNPFIERLWSQQNLEHSYETREGITKLQDKWQPRNLKNAADDKVPFLMSRYGQGRVFAVRDSFQNWTSAQWSSLESAVELSGGSQSSKFDVGSYAGYFTYKIPGIGEPPIKSFQVLISLFFLVAGPGVLIVLKRTNQMQLFFLVVPLLAFITCLSLIGYVIFIEGFDSYGRVQSVTWLDQKHQTAVSQSRAIYYHGLRPKPYHYDSQEAPLGGVFEGMQQCNVWQENGAMNVTGGFIEPRSPHAMVGLASYESKAAVKLVEIESDSPQEKNFRIVNQLGVRAEIIVFRTEEGYLMGESIENGQSKAAVLVDQQLVQPKLSELVNFNSPIEFSSENSGWGWPDSAKSELAVIESLRLSSQLKQLLPTGSYVAILTEFPTVESRLQPVHFLNRLHVVIGQW